MPTLDALQGTVLPIPGDSGRSDAGKVSPEIASNPGRLNRSSIEQAPGRPILRQAPPPPTTPSDTLIHDRSAEKLPTEAVKTHLSESPQPSGSSDPLEGRLEELARDVKYYKANRRKAESKSSEKELKQQVKQLERELHVAKRLQKGTKEIASKAATNEFHRDYGISDASESDVKQKAAGVHEDACEAVEDSKQEVKVAKKKLDDFRSRQRSIRRLDNGLNGLQRSAENFNTKTPSGLLDSVRDHNREIRALEGDLSRAKAVSNGAVKLLKSERKASEQGIELQGFRDQVEDVRSRAGNEVNRLKREIAIMKDSRKSASKREKHEKAELKKAEKFAERQRKVLEQQKKEVRREALAEKKKAKQQPVQQQVQPERVRTDTLAPRTVVQAKKAAVAGAEGDTARLVRMERKDMKAFLSGVRPQKMTVAQLEHAISTMRTPGDYKQVIANISASGLSRDEQVRLRSNVSTALATFVKSEGNVRKIDNRFVAHVMFGNSSAESELLDNYSKTVNQIKLKLG